MIQGACHCGRVSWRFEGMPERATACNCTVCRRYATLWAYDFEGERIEVFGSTRAYSWGEAGIGFHFCQNCGGLAYWRAVNPRDDGRRRIAVNLRLSEDPAQVAAIPVRHLDGFESWKEIERPTNTVSDLWF